MKKIVILSFSRKRKLIIDNAFLDPRLCGDDKKSQTALFTGIARKVACLSLFITIFFVANAQAKDTLATVKPVYGDIQQSFTELARTRLENEYTINLPLSGNLDRISLVEGSLVKKGQILARLDQLPYKLAVDKDESDLKTLQDWYKLQSKTLYRREVLKEKDYVSQEEVDQERAYKDMMAAQIDSTKSKLAKAKYDLTETVIRSPIAGIVLRRYTQGGTWMPEGQRLLSLGKISDLEALSEVLTQDAQLLRVGGTVLLKNIGTDKTLLGKIKEIEPAGFTKKSSLGVDEQRVNVIISIANPQQANLGIGYRLQAEFLVGEQQKNALIIPRFSVLQDNQGNFYVFKVVDKKMRKQIIQIGIKTDTEVSIVKGLSETDKVIAQPTADMQDGMRLKIENI